jgi:hypothetical protein
METLSTGARDDHGFNSLIAKRFRCKTGKIDCRRFKAFADGFASRNDHRLGG